MRRLSADELRALRLLSQRSANEMEEQPIQVLSSLVALGLAERRPYTSRRKSGKLVPALETTITDAGREALKAEDGR